MLKHTVMSCRSAGVHFKKPVKVMQIAFFLLCCMFHKLCEQKMSVWDRFNPQMPGIYAIEPKQKTP